MDKKKDCLICETVHTLEKKRILTYVNKDILDSS